jgi:thioredoxin 1
MKTSAFKKLTTGAGKWVLVDFYADWCGPCQTISPMINQVAKDYGSKISVLKINVDKSRPIAENLNIRSIPTLLIFKEGKIIWRKTGLFTKKELTGKLNSILN